MGICNIGYCSHCANRRPTRRMRFRSPGKGGSINGDYCRKCEKQWIERMLELNPDEIIEYLDDNFEVVSAVATTPRLLVD